MLILGDDTTPPALPPNGSRDVLDCGPGNDSDWINISSDLDNAINCETVHAG